MSEKKYHDQQNVPELDWLNVPSPPFHWDEGTVVNIIKYWSREDNKIRLIKSIYNFDKACFL